jgi:thiosulfate/3-mercaptopyruvate sulfurtransferase
MMQIMSSEESMKRNRHTLWLSSLGLVLILVTTLAVPASSQLPPGKLVSTEWLEQNLPRENLRIVDVRQSIMDYWQSHIPGAVYFNPEALRLADRGVPGKLMPPEALVVMLGKMGVSRKTTVVVCGEQNDFRATYLIWALDYLGHPSAMMLEGGFDKWGKEKRPLTQDYPEIKPVEYDVPAEINQKVRATLQEVKGVVSQGGAVLIDVRPAQLYTGEKGFWKRKGHIKGAINHFWGEDLNEDGSWKGKEELKRLYEELGATPERTIIVSCGQGLMSSHTYFTLKHILGYPNVKNYDGSFNEWSNVDELPVETGVPNPVD